MRERLQRFIQLSYSSAIKDSGKNITDIARRLDVENKITLIKSTATSAINELPCLSLKEVLDTWKSFELDIFQMAAQLKYVDYDCCANDQPGCHCVGRIRTASK